VPVDYTDTGLDVSDRGRKGGCDIPETAMDARYGIRQAADSGSFLEARSREAQCARARAIRTVSGDLIAGEEVYPRCDTAE